MSRTTMLTRKKISSAARQHLDDVLSNLNARSQRSESFTGNQAILRREARGNGLDISSTGQVLARQPNPPNTGGTTGTTTGGATPQPKLDPVIEDARAAAFGRVALAKMRVAGIGPGGPPDPFNPGQQLPDVGTYENQQKARRYASLFFDWPNPNMDQINDILGRMTSALSPGFPITRTTAKDPNCGNRAGYVIDHHAPIFLCPAFFSSSPEERIRTMVHESAHVAGIGQPNGEGYCVVFDYSGPCPGDFSSADSWAQFVNAVTDQPPDKPPTLTGKPGGGTPGGSPGGTSGGSGSGGAKQ